jgi:ubiquinone/menaquinone biosynthesis C-methylase UbiE
MNHNDKVKASFAEQAEKFASYHMSKAEYTDYLIRRCETKGDEHALEVAAGTCICGRALAPFVRDITCLDLTKEMLAQGKRLAQESGIANISFETGDAQELPYEDESFDLVITRLSLHHFIDPQRPFNEMKRVLKRGGKLVIWDMQATEEALRKTDDDIERMRDPSHTRILSKEEFELLFKDDFDMQCEETTLVPVNLESWMNLTDTPEDTRETIIGLMKDDLAGGRKTGFAPYIRDGQIMFDHRWLLLVGIKR